MATRRYCQTTALHGGKVRFRSLKSFEEIVKSYAEHFPPPVDIRVISPNMYTALLSFLIPIS